MANTYDFTNPCKVTITNILVPDAKELVNKDALTGERRIMTLKEAIAAAATVKLVGKNVAGDSSYIDVATYKIPISEAGKVYDYVLPENSPCLLNVKVTGGSAAGKLLIRFEPVSRGY